MANSQLLDGGHDGVARSTDGGKQWVQVESLRGADAMGWAFTSHGILVGGHCGLFQSTGRDLIFSKADGLGQVSDVRTLGAAGDTVYLASPQAGLLTSNDAGATWTFGNTSVGQGFMGTILIDPADPEPSRRPRHSERGRDQHRLGQTWKMLGGPGGTMSVAWDPTNTQRMVAIGMSRGAATKTEVAPGPTFICPPAQLPSRTPPTALPCTPAHWTARPAESAQAPTAARRGPPADRPQRSERVTGRRPQ